MGQAPVKIAYLMDQYVHPYGGTERQILELVRHLDRRRFQPQVAVLRDSEYLKSNEFDCPVQVLGIDKIASATTMLRLFRYVQDLRRNHFSIAHIFFNDASIVAPPFLRSLGLKVVVSRRDMGFWYDRRNIRILRLSRLFVDRVVANSLAVSRVVQENEGFAATKISVIYNGYNNARGEVTTESSARARLGVDPDGAIVGIVANLRAIKRIDDLIKAFAIAARSHANARLVIVGTGELEGALTRLAESLGVRERVVFTGQIADVMPIIQEFSVAVLCSESEGFSNSIIEYMKCGKPTVCTNVGGNPEIVQDGFNGFLVNVADVNALADRIDRLLMNADLAETMGKNALASVRDKYDVSRMVAEHENLYERLITGGQAGSGNFSLSTGSRTKETP